MDDKFKSDFYNYKKEEYSPLKIFSIFRSWELQYLLTGRLSVNKETKFISFWKLLHKLIGRKMGCEIDCFENIGGGLCLDHPFCITVNPKAIIGNNVRLYKGVTIGGIRSGERSGVPVIEDNVVVMCNAMVCGGIVVGHDSLIAANSFVNFNVPPNSIVLGNPGSIHFKQNASSDYL